MAMTDPKQGHTALITMALLAVALGFTSATQDIVIDAYRIEITPTHLLSMSAASYSLGYRLAMILAGGVAFILSDFFGSSLNNYQYVAWQWTYAIMSLAGCLGIVTTLVIREPVNSRPALGADGSKQLLLLFIILLIPFISIFYYWQPLWSQVIDFQQMSPLSLFLFKVLRFVIAALACYLTARLLIQSTWVSTDIAATAYWQPVKEFIQRYPLRLVILLLLLIGFYRVSDMVLGVVANMFYQQLGYSKTDIGIVSKTFGIGVTLLGTVIGGLLTVRIGVMRMMMLGAVLSAATNLLFILLAYSGAHLPLLFVVISADNLAAGFASIAFVTFLSRLSNIRFTAMQYAIFSSLMALLPRVIGGYSGTIVEAYSYPTFFLITTVLGIPVIVLVWLVGKQLTFADDNATMPTSH
nr:MAG: MFS transporter [Gammaproteobacteria bacterium]